MRFYFNYFRSYVRTWWDLSAANSLNNLEIDENSQNEDRLEKKKLIKRNGDFFRLLSRSRDRLSIVILFISEYLSTFITYIYMFKL